MQLRKSGHGSRPRVAKRGEAVHGWPAGGSASSRGASRGYTLAIDAEERALALQKIEDGVEQRLLARAGEHAPCAGSAEMRIGLRVLERGRLDAQRDGQVARGGLAARANLHPRLQAAQAAQQFARGQLAPETLVSIRLNHDAPRALASQAESGGGADADKFPAVH